MDTQVYASRDDGRAHEVAGEPGSEPPGARRLRDAQGTGYTSGAFYFQFKNKADCFWHVVAHRERLRGDWASEITRGLDPATAGLEDVLARTFAASPQPTRGSPPGCS